MWYIWSLNPRRGFYSLCCNESSSVFLFDRSAKLRERKVGRLRCLFKQQKNHFPNLCFPPRSSDCSRFQYQASHEQNFLPYFLFLLQKLENLRANTRTQRQLFFWLYVSSVFIRGNTLRSTVDSILFDSFPFTVFDLSLLYLDRFRCMSL